MTRPVLAGVDGSSRSRAAALWAADEAVRRGAPLRLIHVWPWLGKAPAHEAKEHELQAGAERMLAELTKAVHHRHPDLDVTTDLVPDDTAADGLAAAAEEGGLLVVGTRGLGGFRGLLVGSISLATAARAGIPTVLVRAEQPEDTDWRENASGPEIVVGLDPRSPADAVLDFAFREAALHGAALRVVHGWDLPPVYGYAGWVPPETEIRELGALEAELLSEALADRRERHPDTKVIEDVRPGGAANALVDASEQAALVIVGRRARAHSLGPRLGPVAHAVIHHAKAPTVVVPHP